MTYKIQNNVWWYQFEWTKEECEKQFKKCKLDKKHWNIVFQPNEKYWKLIWEWNYRTVFEKPWNEFFVIKVWKDEIWEMMNREEANHYLEEASLINKWMKISNALAKCYLIWKDLIMEKLTPVKWSKNQWFDKNWILKTYDLV